MGGNVGKRARRAKPCCKCGMKITSDFLRTRAGDVCKSCWPPLETEKENKAKGLGTWIQTNEERP